MSTTFRLKVKRHDQNGRIGFVVAPLSELHALIAQPEVEVMPDAYNPPGFVGALS